VRAGDVAKRQRLAAGGTYHLSKYEIEQAIENQKNKEKHAHRSVSSVVTLQ